MLYNLHFYLVPEGCHQPKRKLHTHKALTPHSPFPQLLATTNLVSVSVDFSILDILYKWNRAICGLLCLASFTLQNFLRFNYIIACLSTLFLFMAEYYSIVWMDPILFIHSSTDGRLGYFYHRYFLKIN